LEDSVSREIRFSRQGLIAEMMGIAELAFSVKVAECCVPCIEHCRQLGLIRVFGF